MIVVRIAGRVTVRSLRKNHRFFLVPHLVTARNPVLPLESGFSQTIIGEVVIWMSHPENRPFVDLILRSRIEVEEMIEALLGEKGSSTKQQLSKTISKLIKNKLVDPTLGRLMLGIVEISTKAVHSMEITP
jgi:SOS-response transcriptional repressor LexA